MRFFLSSSNGWSPLQGRASNTFQLPLHVIISCWLLSTSQSLSLSPRKMAEAVLFNVAQGILNILGSQLLQEIRLLRGVEAEFDRFKDTVSAIQAVLLDAEEQSASSHQVRQWLTQLKDAMRGAENLMDGFSIEATRRRVMRGNKLSKEARIFFSSSNQVVYGLKMAHRIRDMRTRLDEIAASRKFHLEERPSEGRAVAVDRRQTHSHPPEVVVGREADVGAILELLLSRDYEENVGVVPIVGIGGLGKTTLAQLVFNHARVKEEFEPRIWVCVADDFDLKAIVKRMLRSTQDIDMDLIIDMLHERINGKKYLLVLDDVWNEDPLKWCGLKDLLVGGAKGSRIIVTTRLANVATLTRPIEVHQLRGLSAADSWSLFSQMAYPRGEVPSATCKEIAEEIVVKCAGVPLALKAIGAMLFGRTDSEWSSFRSKELLALSEGEGNILSILKISYDHLPSYLKHCFAYCCLFPKDHVINVPKLLNLWMAQGFLDQQCSSGCREDVSLECFMDLLRRSFFQEVTKDELGNIQTCKMHDLIHDLAQQMAGSDVVVSDPEGQLVNKKIRHVSFKFGPTTSWKLPGSLLEANDVRTFLLLHDSEDDFESQCVMDEKQWNVFSRNHRCIRSLDLHSSGIDKIPRSISRLKHLRDIDLSYNYRIELLPDSITKLYNLQVLRLMGCYNLVELPKDIDQLINLSQLDLAGCNKLRCMPRGLGKLNSLHLLTMFMVSRGGSASKRAARIEELHGLNNLRGQLEISNLISATSNVNAANLKEKQYLQKLTLDWGATTPVWWFPTDDIREMGEDEMTLALESLEPHKNLKVLSVMRNTGTRFPKWLSCLTKVVQIVLWNCKKCKYIPPLHQLPHLRSLSIVHFYSLEYVDSEDTVQETSSFFPSLEVLDLTGCPMLKGWWRRPSTAATTLQWVPRFNLLSVLHIRGCPNLASMPLFPPLKSLEFGAGGVEFIQYILKARATAEQIASTASSSFSIAFSKLQELEIVDIEDLNQLQEELFCHMGSLKVLRIHNCGGLNALGRSLGYLTSLETLRISDCKDLNVLEDERDDHHVACWLALGCFHFLTLEFMPDMVSLPKWLCHLHTLRELRILACDNLRSLSDSLVELTSLKRLQITHCDQLSKRCGSNKGEDWPYIAHIPNIRVNDTVVQRNGRYLL